MDMIERVARALCTLHGSDPDRIVPGEIGHGTYEGVAGAVMAVRRIVGTKVTEPHPLWLHFVADAKVAIEAMREATEQMILAGGPAFDANVYMGGASDRAKEKAAANWEAMIDAALRDT